MTQQYDDNPHGAAAGPGVRVTVTIERIGPDEAKRYLESNAGNRGQKEGKIRTYTSDMEAGRWLLNGESIKFSSDGRLKDGQNRLMAIIRSGATIDTVVVRGLLSAAQVTMDTGAPRRLNDVLQMRGERNVNSLATVVRAIANFAYFGAPFTTGHAAAPSQQQYLAILDKYPDLRDATTFGAGRNVEGLSRSNVATLYWLFKHVDVDDARRFFDLLVHGEGLFKGDPVHTLRERLLKDSGRNNTPLSAQAKTVFTIKAWNAWRSGAHMSLLKWNSTEPFPEIAGLPKDIFT